MIKKFGITSFFNLNKYKIKQQLYLMYSAVVVVPIILIGIFLLLYTYRMMVGYHTELLDSDNHRVRNVLFEITTQIYNISENITFDDDIQNILTKDYTDLSDYVETVSYSGLLDYYEKNYAEISSITIIRIIRRFPIISSSSRQMNRWNGRHGIRKRYRSQEFSGRGCQERMNIETNTGI